MLICLVSKLVLIMSNFNYTINYRLSKTIPNTAKTAPPR